ncbi:DNA cytosine methyltransferase [Tessaracoccus sp. SD287]|uniref:DNA cytosine methyltransferase n=1 Tax=Tessaracoccus sp. SD287 TaxID=2782008 RepID=UPI001A957709|nr:DNA cytosine methyltransferase [Tessaracoccus sp. SD287]
MSGTTVSRSALHARTQRKQRSQLRIGSLFSGYGGLDLAVEHVFNARTVWFSELNEPVARVFARHWPDAPNLGDITTIDWSLVEPVDILIGGFPCQDVSTVGKRAGLAPGTRSGLWAHMAEAIDALQPEWVVIENVRGLLSSPATRHATKGDDHEQRNPGDATPDDATLRGLEPTRGIWETTQLDLYGLWAPFSGIWPTCGWMRDGSAYRLPLSALLTNASASSPSPGALFRTPLASDSSRGGETLDQVRARRGTIALSHHQIIDFALHGPAGSPSRRAESETLWSLIDGLFDAGDATLTPSPVGNTSPDDPRQHQPS